MDIKFMHLGHTGQAKHQGVVTLAWRLAGERIEYGLAFCSPKDQFSKKLGRRIAAGRLAARPNVAKSGTPLRYLLGRLRGGYYPGLPDWFDKWVPSLFTAPGGLAAWRFVLGYPAETKPHSCDDPDWAQFRAYQEDL